MWVFDRWSPYSYQNNREKYKDDEEKREFNLKECLWFCMTSLTPQVRFSVRTPFAISVNLEYIFDAESRSLGASVSKVRVGNVCCG